MSDYPSFPFYVKDWLASGSVRAMTVEQRGLYADLLFHAWEEEGLPTNEMELRRMIGATAAEWRRAWPVVGHKFERRGERLVNARQEEVREGLKRYAVQGSLGGRAKWGPSADRHGATRRQRLAEARLRGSHTADEWAEMLATYGSSCIRCGGDDMELVKDHIIPLSMGGDDSLKNLQPLCRRCNSSKGPETIDFRVRDPRTKEAWLPPSVRLAGCLAVACIASAFASAVPPPGFTNQTPPGEASDARSSPADVVNGHEPEQLALTPPTPKRWNAPPPSGTVAAFVEAYKALYAEHRGQSYGRPETREWKHVKDMLGAFGYERLTTMARHFVAEPSVEYPFNGGRTISELWAHRRLIEGRLIEAGVLPPSALAAPREGA